VQLDAAPPSIAQVVVYGATPPETLKTTLGLALLLVEPLTGELMLTTGSAVLMLHVYVAGVASALPAASVAATVNVCPPLPRPEYVFGLVQLAAAPPSIVQLNVLPASVEVKEKLAFELLLGLVGFAVIVVFGATVSIDHVKAAGDASVLPAASVAATVNVWLPSASAV
jgi:hypothetical protein